MIVVTRLNRTRFAVNPDLIERIQATPDTTLIMVDGATFVITETMDEVIDQIVDLRARVLAAAHRWTAPGSGTTTIDATPHSGEDV
ncbi:flagellar FlbD family protein [Microbacterium sp. NPDC056234]|uniref:flagellar FlbD family protein n=1 Tax=Microbacterium sp. NPDC056234 TaxID=3345757 RepID=UPI0035D8A3A1